MDKASPVLVEDLVYEVWRFTDDPDHKPSIPAEQGRWVWWRTGPHPRGQWQRMWTNTPGFLERFAENRADHPVAQDTALCQGEHFGEQLCHACAYQSSGQFDAGHFSSCDGVCRLDQCYRHRAVRRVAPIKRLETAYRSARRSGLSAQQIFEHLQNLEAVENLPLHGDSGLP